MKAVRSPVLTWWRAHDRTTTARGLYPRGQRLGRPFRQWSKGLDQVAKTRFPIFDTGTNTAWTSGPTLLSTSPTRRTPLRRALPLGLLAALVLPASAMADTFDAAGAGKLPLTVGINSTWVIVAAM